MNSSTFLSKNAGVNAPQKRRGKPSTNQMNGEMAKPMMMATIVDMVSPFIEVDGSHYRTSKIYEKPIHHVRHIGERCLKVEYVL